MAGRFWSGAVRRAGAVAGIGIVAVAALGGSASADAVTPNPNKPVVNGDGHPFPPGTICPFAVYWVFIERVKVVQLPDGGSVFTGSGPTFTISNAERVGGSLTINPSGTANVGTQPNGDRTVTLDGKNLFGDGAGTLLLTNGHFTVIYDGDGNVVQPLDGSGQVTDVCALIA